MSKKLLAILVAAMFVSGLAGGTAYAGKGIFEAPLVANGGAEVAGSEGKIERGGDYKVEIEGIAALTTFEICILDIQVGLVFLQDSTSDADGELKVDRNLNTDAPASFPAGMTTTLQAPTLQVLANSGADDCSGAVVWESGMDVVIP